MMCDHCAEHGYTMHEGCTYGAADDMDSDSRHLNVISYNDCAAKCTATDGCVGVTYYTKYHSGSSIASGVTDELASDGSGPMLCVLKKSMTDLTCHTGTEHFQEVVSGNPCTTRNIDYYGVEDYEFQNICTDLCETCHITDENREWTHRSMTREHNCIHDGTGFIETKQGIVDELECVRECHLMTDAGINTCTHVRFTTALATNAIGTTGPDGNPVAQGDCELYEQALDNTRTCNENTVGQITSRYCAHEELCHVGCGDLDECADGTGYNDCAAIAEAGGFGDSVTCANTIGSYTCSRGAGSLVPTEGAWVPGGGGGDGLSGWTSDSGDPVTIEPGSDGEVTITGLDASPMTGTINGNTITVPNPADPENPLIGTISADGKTIDWTQGGVPQYSMGRTDIDECTPDDGSNPCADQADTLCYNTSPGFACNCDINNVEWTFTDANGVVQTVTVAVNSNVAPKAGVTFTIDGTEYTGTLLNNIIEYDDGNGNIKTGTIDKSNGGTTIDFVNADGSTAEQWGRTGGGTGGTPGDNTAGDPATGDPATGDPATGDPATGDPATGDPANPTDDPNVVTGSDPGAAGLVTDPTMPAPVPADPADPADPSGAGGNNANGVTGDPADPADPANPADPADPATPADPADPADPTGSGGNNANGLNGDPNDPTGNGGNNAAGLTGSVTGDPHFRINFNSQKDICFDIAGHNGTVFNLLHEPKSGLIINGEIRDVVWKNHRSHRLSKIGVISPEGGRVAFSLDGIETFTHSGEARRFDYNTYAGMIMVDDIMLSTQSLERFRHKGATFEVGDSTFSISIKDSKQSIKFYIDNERHIETGVDGLLGFTMAQSYTVSNQGVHGRFSGT